MVSKLQGEEMLKEQFYFRNTSLIFIKILSCINTITPVNTINLHIHTRLISRCKITARQSARWKWKMYKVRKEPQNVQHTQKVLYWF